MLTAEDRRRNTEARRKKIENKPNLGLPQIDVSFLIITYYDKNTAFCRRENKPNHFVLSDACIVRRPQGNAYCVKQFEKTNPMLK